MSTQVVNLTDQHLLDDPLLKQKLIEALSAKILRDNPPKAGVVHLCTGCHKWTGGKSGKYGVVTVTHNGVTYRKRAHMASYMAYKGIIRNSRVLHLCQEELCINPEHLILGNASLNAQHALMMRKTTDPLNRTWKLTTPQVENIRRLYYLYNFTQKELAEMHGVTKSTISSIVNKKSWKI